MPRLTLASLAARAPEHVGRLLPGPALGCRCGRAFAGTGASMEEAFRDHVTNVIRGERAARRKASKEGRRSVDQARRALLPCSIASFAFACGITRRAARIWLGRRGLTAPGGRVVTRWRMEEPS